MASESRGIGLNEANDLDRRYALDTKSVAAEIVNDEIVAIDFSTGKYHGVRGRGVTVWRLLEQGFSTREIIDWLAGKVTDFDEAQARAIVAFVSKLENEGLMLRSNPELPVSKAGDSEGMALVSGAPELDSRDDLQDYLALDPIHDVDERGWPNARR